MDSKAFMLKQKTMTEQEGKLAELKELFSKMNTRFNELIVTRELMEENLKAQ